jgi:hypothetical protein
VSQIWPDIPELDGIPEVLRSGIWMRAYTRALSRRSTWAWGLSSVAISGWGCGFLGDQIADVMGAVLGGLAGFVIGSAFFVRVILEWRARRLVPEVRNEAGWGGTTTGDRARTGS